MTTAYTRKWLDADGFYSSCKDFTRYNSQMVFYDPGPLINNAQIIGTSDGESFASILDIDSAVSGIDVQGDLSGASQAVLNGNLFISQHSPNPGNASILEWDGTTLTQHLKTLFNYETHSLLAWGNKLWIVTDVTPGIGDNNRTVIYYDGTDWTTVIDYDLAANFPYDKAAGLPQTDNIHRVTQLYLHGNNLYLFATHYNVGTAQWNWDVWLAKSVSGVFEFNKIAIIDDGYVFSSVFNHGGVIYVTANAIDAGGVLQDAAKVYSSTDMITWTLEATIAGLGVPFGEQAFDGKMFLSTVEIATGNTLVYYLDRFTGEYVLDATITTNTTPNQSGALFVLGGSLYVGKWREVYVRGAADDDGDGDGDRKIVITIRTRWKTPAGLTVFRHYSILDVRGPTIFWAGLIQSMSSSTRAVDDNTGLAIISNFSLDLDNTEKEFSILLASYEIKNQILEVFYGREGGLQADLRLVTRLIVVSREIKGPVFTVSAKDPAVIYFNRKVPGHILTVTEFPNIHPDVKGNPAMEFLGLHSKTTGENLGSVEARLVDTTTYKYLAAYRTLHSVPEVYSGGVLKQLTAHYVITYLDGYTFIVFNSSQGSKKITFNCAGYIVEGWNSVNGYVQNPAYVALYFLNQIMEMPTELIDYEAADALALTLEDLGEGESGKLSLEVFKDPEKVLADLTYGLFYLYRDTEGRHVMKRKDISDFADSIYIFDQIDALRPSENLDSADEIVNHAKVRWNFHSATAQFAESKTVTRQPSVDLLGPEQEPKTEWDFPFVTSESLIDLVTSEKLLKYAYGNKRKKIILSIEWLNELEILRNIQFQDPYGISLDGSGEVGRRYFIESITPDLIGQTIEIICADLQWLLQQYFILGDRSALPNNWADASVAQRLYAFACDRATGTFADGEPGKIVIDRALIE